MKQINVARLTSFARLTSMVVMSALAVLFFSTVALAQEEPATTANPEPGVLLVTVAPESPAAEAGLRRGDIVLRVGDNEINDAMALRVAIAELAPGDEVVLTVLRGDDEREVTVILGDRNGLAFLGVAPYMAATIVEHGFVPAVPGDGDFDWKQLPDAPVVEVITGTVRMSRALMIVEVVDESPAAAAGLAPEEVITALNGEPLADPNALIAMLKELAPGDEITLTIGSGEFAMGEETGDDTAANTADATERTVTVVLGEHPERSGAAYLGVRVAPRITVLDSDGTLPNGMQPQDRLFRRFQFGLPPMLPRLHERMEEWREEQGECQCGPQMPPQMQRRWYFMPRDGRQEFRREWREEQHFTRPFGGSEGNFFWFEAPPVDEEVVILHDSTGAVDMMMLPGGAMDIIEGHFFLSDEFDAIDSMILPSAPTDMEEHFFLPEGQFPAMPSFEISEELL